MFTMKKVLSHTDICLNFFVETLCDLVEKQYFWWGLTTGLRVVKLQLVLNLNN